MNQYSNWAEEQRRADKARRSNVGEIVMVIIYLLVGFWFYQMWGWWGILITIPVAWIPGGILSGAISHMIAK